MKKLLNFRPILFIAISLCFGLLMGYSIVIKSVLTSVLLVAIFLVACFFYIYLSFLNKNYKKSIIFSITLMIFFFVGLFSFSLTVDRFERSNLNAHTLTVSGRITYLEETDDSFKFVLSDVEFSGYKNGKTDYKIQVYCTGINDFSLGDLIRFTDKIYDYTVVYDQDFSANNISSNVKYFAYLDSENIAVKGNRLTVLEKCNLFLKDSLKSGLKEEEFALAYAMLLGNSDYMDFGVLNQFRSAGIAHIFAVSGLHVGFIALVLKWFFDKLKANKYLKLVLVGFIVFFYAGICGFSASSIRASIMCVVMLFSESIFERYDPLSAVGVSALIILLFSPIELFCVGFQLSFVVVLGIVLLSGFFMKVFRKLPKKIASSLATVVSAQVVGIPVCLAVFNKVSLISIVTNFLFLPIASVIFISVFVCAIIGGLLFIPKIVLFLPGIALSLVNRLMSFINYGFFDFGGITLGVFAIFFYALLLVAVGFFNFRRKIKNIICVVLALVVVIGTTFYNVGLYNSEKVVVYGSQNLCFTLYVYRGDTTLVVNKYVTGKGISQIKRVMNKESLSSIEKLIVPKQAVWFDLQFFLTKLNAIDLPEVIIYYDENNNVNHSVIEKSFGITSVYNLAIVKEMRVDDMLVASDIYGYGVNLKTKSFDFTAVSNIPDNVLAKATVNSGRDLLVLSNRKDYLFSNNQAKNKVSYLSDTEYTDAESFGYVKYIKK